MRTQFEVEHFINTLHNDMGVFYYATRDRMLAEIQCAGEACEHLQGEALERRLNFIDSNITELCSLPLWTAKEAHRIIQKDYHKDAPDAVMREELFTYINRHYDNTDPMPFVIGHENFKNGLLLGNEEDVFAHQEAFINDYFKNLKVEHVVKNMDAFSRWSKAPSKQAPEAENNPTKSNPRFKR